jgi:DNA-binding response OmpR family regulator
MAKILVVEDDAPVRTAVSDYLAFHKHTVETAADGAEGFHRLQSYNYDLIILDWELPSLAGVDVCKRFRHGGGKTPVLMLTGRKAIVDKESGFDAGADDYLTKPFELRELIIRVKALLRRPAGVVSEVLSAGLIALDTTAMKVMCGDSEIRLLPREYALLEFLLRNKNKFFQAEELLNSVWDADKDSSAVAVRQCIKRLRARIDSPDAPSIITNRIGLGYGIVESE